MKKFFNLKLIIFILLLSAVLILTVALSSCSILTLLDNFNFADSYLLNTTKITLDENELNSLEITNQTSEEKIDVTSEASISNAGLRDPFKPFSTNSNKVNEDESNMLVAKKIYSESGIFYVEISFNESVYKLKIDDLFGKIYQVKAINADSVVLLRGDEVLTLFINEIYND